MNKIATVAAALLIGTVIGGPAALAQTTTAPDSGAHPGMMGMMERGYGHHGWFQGRGAMSPTMMHIIFSLMDADGDGKLTLQAQPSFGSILVDHSARSSTSLSVTVITSDAPSIAMLPKNCIPSLGGRFCPCSLLGAFANTTCGPNVASSWFGPNVPA
jgi:hypothetical protein